MIGQTSYKALTMSFMYGFQKFVFNVNMLIFEWKISTVLFQISISK